MKVLYLSDNTSGHNQRFLEKLAESGIDVWFLDPSADGLPEGWLPDRVHWIRPSRVLPRDTDPGTFAGFLGEFRQVLQSLSPDLVHAGPTHTAGYLAALANARPCLLMSWGSDILFHADHYPDRKRATEIALRHADGFFFDCLAVRAAAKKLADVPNSRVVQFPWGIKRGSFTPTGPLPDKQEFPFEAGRRVLICTRSWEPLYGTGVLLEAFRQAHRVDSSLRLLLLGSGEEAGSIKRFISTHRMEGVISTLGQVATQCMPKWFRAADVYVSCAQTDGTSVSLLEAMATGLPVVVTDIASNREWVVEKQNGWLAPADSVEGFARQFLRVARLSSEQRSEFSERNRRLVEERADWDRNFPKLLEMYEQLAAKLLIR